MAPGPHSFHCLISESDSDSIHVPNLCALLWLSGDLCIIQCNVCRNLLSMTQISQWACGVEVWLLMEQAIRSSSRTSAKTLVNII